MQISSIICYLRRSRQDIEKEKRTGEDTLATQKNIMLQALNKFEIPFDTVEEIGSGDKIETRPVFQQVLSDLKAGKYNAIAVKEIPRIGRGTYSDMGQIYDLIMEKRIFIITPHKIYDPSNPSDLRQIRFELFLAREEFEMIKERLVGAKYNLAAEGKWVVGAAPYGYELNSRTSRLQPTEEEAQIVRLIFTLYVYGLEDENGIKKDVSFRAIATYLTNLGIPTPRKAKSWSYLTVKRILENPVYHGTLKYRTRKRVGNKYYDRPENEWIVVENAHEPLIDDETWNLAQKKLNKLSGKLPNTKLDFSPCELAGLVTCSKCGNRMIRQYSVQHYTKKDGEKSVYKKEFLWCRTLGCTFVKYRDVENSIIKYLKMLGSFDMKKLKELFNDTYNQQKEVAAAADTEALAQKRAAELKRRLDFICEKYENGIYDDEMFLRRKMDIERELETLEKISDKQPANNKNEYEQDLKTLKENIKTFLKAYKETENKTLRNKLLRELVDQVIVNKTGRGKFDLHIYPRFF